MCGRFSLYEPTDRLAEYFGVDEVTIETNDPSWNVAPSQPIVAVASSRDGSSRRLGTLIWGLVPSWSTDPTTGSRLINARAETVASAPSFRRAFERRRCLVPVNGFFEWQAAPTAKRRGQPYYVAADNGSLLALGGIWEVWHGPDDEVRRTVAIITTVANDELSRIHDRMPVIVEPECWARWLAPEELAPAEAGAVLRPAPRHLLTRRVSDQVNSPKNNGPELIEPLRVQPDLLSPGIAE
jgi:putative SOS response-associated peptidase YedK